MFCRFCGKQIDDSSAFCGFCGKAVWVLPKADGGLTKEGSEGTLPQKKKTAGKKKGILISVGIVLLALVIFVCCRLAGSMNESKNEKKSADKPVNEEVDSHYSDILRLIQGRWYLGNYDDPDVIITIKGDDCTIYTYNLPDAAVLLTGADHYSQEGRIEITTKGELTVCERLSTDGGKTWQDRVYDYIYYKYDKDADSVTLSYEGNTLDRY